MFYYYSQNNSGGFFVYDAERGISVNVFVEAASADEANSKAEEVGLYFDGAGDCPCCGDRWWPQWGNADFPDLKALEEDLSHYDETRIRWVADDQNSSFIHFKDGRVEGRH